MALLEVKNLRIHFPIRGGFFNTVKDHVRAVDDVSFTIEEGKTYGLIGESGSGKTTVGKAIVGLERPTGGEILYEGTRVNTNLQRRKIKYNENVQSPSGILSGFPMMKNCGKYCRCCISSAFPPKAFINTLTSSQADSGSASE